MSSGLQTRTQNYTRLVPGYIQRTAPVVATAQGFALASTFTDGGYPFIGIRGARTFEMMISSEDAAVSVNWEILGIDFLSPPGTAPGFNGAPVSQNKLQNSLYFRLLASGIAATAGNVPGDANTEAAARADDFDNAGAAVTQAFAETSSFTATTVLMNIEATFAAPASSALIVTDQPLVVTLPDIGTFSHLLVQLWSAASAVNQLAYYKFSN